MCVPVGQNVRPLNKREYILDIATEAETVDTNYSLWFRRVIWSLALKLDNELYVTMHYNQVKIYLICRYYIYIPHCRNAITCSPHKPQSDMEDVSRF